MVNRIAILTSVMARGYGVSRVIHEQSLKLCKKNFEVDVFATRYEKCAFGKEPYRIIRVPFVPFLLKTHIERGNYDWVIAHTEPFFSMLPALSEISRTVYYEHGVAPKVSETGELTLESRLISHRGKLANNVDGCVTVSKYIKNLLDLKDAAVIPNSGSHVLSAFSDKRENRLLYIGRLGKGEMGYKGLNELLKIANACKDRFEIVMAVKGNDQLAQPFREAGLKVHLNCSTDEISTLLKTSAVLLALSRYESSDLPLLEALASKTLPLALSGGAHGEFGGKIFETSDKMIRFLRTTTFDELLEFAQAESGTSSYTWEENTDLLVRFMRSIPQRKRGLKRANNKVLQRAIEALWSPFIMLHDIFRKLFR
ncbi:hypothetical protein CHISP_1594 [Chitinispirillum alkaliphilum]|nr:hypothetical protein CHISP_1594 [Chitinispirillum alkaliphilum]